jgi:hypothetical protein
MKLDKTMNNEVQFNKAIMGLNALENGIKVSRILKTMNGSCI